MTSVSREPVELRQSAANLLQFPVLIAVVVLAMAIRQLFAHLPSTIILGACAGLAALDIVLVVYLLRNMASTLAVTADDITFTRRRARGEGPPPQQVIQRAARHRRPPSRRTIRLSLTHSTQSEECMPEACRGGLACGSMDPVRRDPDRA